MAQESATATELETLRTRIERWRSTRAKHGPMPEALWAEAARLARRDGVCPVSRALRVGYESLQQRVRAIEDNRSHEAPPVFVELSGAELTRTRAAAQASALVATGEVVVEIADARGLQVTLRLPAGYPLDLGTLLSAVRELRA